LAEIHLEDKPHYKACDSQLKNITDDFRQEDLLGVEGAHKGPNKIGKLSCGIEHEKRQYCDCRNYEKTLNTILRCIHGPSPLVSEKPGYYGDFDQIMKRNKMSNPGKRQHIPNAAGIANTPVSTFPVGSTDPMRAF